MADPTEVKTSYKNAVDFLTYANQSLAELGVIDADGNPARFVQYASSPAWLFALAHGKLMSEYQEALRVANSAVSIYDCTDAQVLNLAAIAGVARSEGKSSYVQVSMLNTGSSAITLPIGTQFQDPQNGIFWATELEYEIQPGTEHLVNTVLYAANVGAYVLNAGLTLTNAVYPRLTVTTTLPATVGSSRETIAQLRNRIQRGAANVDPVIACEDAIAQLSGVIKCVIWCNTSTLEDMQLVGGVTVPPRSAYIVIQGTDVNAKIAETYFKYMNVPTTQTPTALPQPYVRGRLPVTVYYDVAKRQTVKFRVGLAKGSAQRGYDQEIARLILQRSDTLDLGATISEISVASWLSGVTKSQVYSVDLSWDGVTWYDLLRADANALVTWSYEDITIEEVDV